MDDINLQDELSKLTNDVTSIKTALIGLNGGDGGLIKRVDEYCQRQTKLENRFNGLVGWMIGAGVLTGGITAGVVKAIFG